MIRNAILTAVTAVVIAPAFAAEWIGDLDKAKEAAAAADKPILVDFTGSDWCGFCIRMRREVFDTPEFEKYAQDRFILAEVDVPNKPKFSAEQLKKNQALCEQYNITGFPTVLVMNSEGKVLGGFGGGRTSLDEVTPHLDRALENTELYRKAATQEGAEKLQTLVTIYRNYPKDLRKHATDVRDAILAADTDDTTGMRGEIAVEQQRDKFRQEWEGANDPQTMRDILERQYAEAMPANRKGIAARLLNVRMALAQTVEDITAIKPLMLEMLETLPEEQRAKAAAEVEAQFADPQEILNRIRKMRGE